MTAPMPSTGPLASTTRIPPSTAIADVLVLHHLRGWLSPPLRPFHAGPTPVLGTALTVQLESADGSAPPLDALYDVLSSELVGRVLVVAGAEGCPGAVWGQILSRAAHGCGATGVLVAGAVRDVAALPGEGVPVWGLSEATVGPAGTVRISAVEEPVQIGGTAIDSGSTIVLDSGGVVALPAPDALCQRVLDDARAYAAAEDNVLAELSRGAPLVEAYRHKRAEHQRIRANADGSRQPRA